jgi:hypothetical protein
VCVQYLLGCWVGTWISVHFVFKEPQARKKVPKQVSKEGQSVNWVHERWVESKWEIELDNGLWSPFPPSAQDMIEEALQNHQAVVVLKVKQSNLIYNHPSCLFLRCYVCVFFMIACAKTGDYGEHCYRLDLLSNIATNLTSPNQSELRIRRAPAN